MAKGKIEQLTVKDLLKACQKAVREGKGDKYIVVSDDNEGNGFHGCFFGLTDMDEDYMELVNDSVMDKDKLIIVG